MSEVVWELIEQVVCMHGHQVVHLCRRVAQERPSTVGVAQDEPKWLCAVYDPGGSDGERFPVPVAAPAPP
jgi:hypothetical protein